MHTLTITILIEGAIISGYSLWVKKPLVAMLLISILANLITQSILWIVLHLLFQYYLTALVTSEIFIWLIEGFLFYGLSSNWLGLREAMFLSLFMNLASLSLGWFMPV
jgi:hypothetical protein